MQNKKVKIGILETGRMPDGLAQHFGDYPSLFTNWLGPLEAEFENIAVLDGAIPQDPTSCDVWLITGSRVGVYENHSWIPPLEDFIRACRDAGQKMIGICFGHQLIAQALGGVVEKSPEGWGLGVHQYKWINWPTRFGPLPKDLRLQAFHQDQVVRIPPGATTIAESKFCRNAAIWYPGFAITVQGHPEMPVKYAKSLIEVRRGTALSETDAINALAAIDAPTTQHALSLFIRDRLANI